MAFRPLLLPKSPDDVLHRMMAAIISWSAQITQKTHLDSQVIESQSLKAGRANLVPHGLGRALKGWTLTRVRGSASIWDAQDANTSPTKTLDLRTSADVSADVLVF